MLTEPLTRALERSTLLDALGKRLTALFDSRVRPGRAKDLLAGTWLGHPLHPLLTDLPTGAWSSALVVDAFGGEPGEAAADLLVAVGSVAALPTVLAGLSELADIVRAEERSVASAHALSNLAALALFVGSYASRRRGHRSAGRALSLAGLTAMGAGGYLGGHLAYRRGVGVNQTSFLDQPTSWTPVLGDPDLPDEQPRKVQVNSTSVLLYRCGGCVYAIADRCSHRGGPLHEGQFTGATVRCPWHDSVFCLADGTVLRGPATAPQPAYEVRVASGSIEVRVRS